MNHAVYLRRMLQHFVILSSRLYHTFAFAVWGAGLLIVDRKLPSSAVCVCVCVCVRARARAQCCKVVWLFQFLMSKTFCNSKDNIIVHNISR